MIGEQEMENKAIICNCDVLIIIYEISMQMTLVPVNNFQNN